LILKFLKSRFILIERIHALRVSQALLTKQRDYYAISPGQPPTIGEDDTVTSP